MTRIMNCKRGMSSASAIPPSSAANPAGWSRVWGWGWHPRRPRLHLGSADQLRKHNPDNRNALSPGVTPSSRPDPISRSTICVMAAQVATGRVGRRRVKANSSNCSLFKRAVTAVCLCWDERTLMGEDTWSRWHLFHRSRVCRPHLMCWAARGLWPIESVNPRDTRICRDRSLSCLAGLWHG